MSALTCLSPVGMSVVVIASFCRRRLDGRKIGVFLSGAALKMYPLWQQLESVQFLAAYLYSRLGYSHLHRYSVSSIHRIILGERLLDQFLLLQIHPDSYLGFEKGAIIILAQRLDGSV